MKYNSNKVYFLILSFLLIPLASIDAQQSLEQIMRRVEGKPDTVRIRFLDSVCFSNRNNDQSLAIKCGEEALKISRRIGNKRLECRTLNVVGVVFRSFGNYERSIESFINAYETALAIRDSIEMGYAENNLGHTYRMKGYFRHSLEHTLNGYNIFQLLKDTAGLAYSSIGLGNFYVQQKNYSKAMSFFNQALEYRKKIKDRTGQFNALTYIGDVYVRSGEVRKAFELFLDIEKGYKELGNEWGIAEVYGHMGSLYLKLKDYEKALHYTTAAADLSSRVGNLSSQISKLKTLTLIYAGMNRYHEGEAKILKALELAKKYRDDYLTLGCFQTMSEFMELKGDFQSAYKYAKAAYALRDTLEAREIAAGAAEIELIYKSERAWREKLKIQTNLEAEKKENTYLIIILLLTFFSSLVLYWRFRYRHKVNRRLHDLNATKDKFFSIIAHDLKNPFLGLIGVSTLMEEEIKAGNMEDIAEYASLIKKSTEHGYALLDNLLEWSRIQTGKLEMHICPQNVKQMANSVVALIMPGAMDKDISIHSDIPEGLYAMADGNILSTIIRNLVSNAVKYTREGGQINISASTGNCRIYITVKDNGIGISQEVLEKLFRIDGNVSTPGTRREKGTGLGLILCREFVTKMDGTIWAESTPGQGTSFTFSIPEADAHSATEDLFQPENHARKDA